MYDVEGQCCDAWQQAGTQTSALPGTPPSKPIFPPSEQYIKVQNSDIRRSVLQVRESPVQLSNTCVQYLLLIVVIWDGTQLVKCSKKKALSSVKFSRETQAIGYVQCLEPQN